MNLSLIKTVMPNDSVGIYLIDNVWHDLDLINSWKTRTAEYESITVFGRNKRLQSWFRKSNWQTV